MEDEKVSWSIRVLHPLGIDEEEVGYSIDLMDGITIFSKGDF
jgi:hypothetical protein